MLAKPVLTATLLATLATGAQADTFLAGPLYLHDPVVSGGYQVNCRLFNGGTKPVKIKAARLYDNTGVNVSISNGCPTTLPAKASCVISTIVAFNLAYSCLVSVDTDALISGVLEARNSQAKEFIPLQRE